MKELFCENPVGVYVVLGVAGVVLAGLWIKSRQSKYLKLLLIPAVLAGGTVLLDALVETDREALQRAAREIAADFQAGNIDVAVGYVAESYTGFGDNRDALIARARSELKRLDIRTVNLTNFQVHIEGMNAEMAVTSTIHLQGGQEGTYAFRWKLQWARLPEGWRIVHVAMPQQVLPGFEQ